MGRDKALLTYRGQSFLESIIRTLREAGIEHITVVLGHHAEEIRRAVNLRGAEVVVNADYRLGQTSSLQAGLRALAASDLAAIVLCLVDHPLVAPGTVRTLTAALGEPGVVAAIPTHHGQHGHPVVIGKELFAELNTLPPEIGANTVVRRHQQTTKLVEVDDPGILADIDNPETYHRLASQ
ncbi:MAG: nucleotidyltransferase family protein [Acidobacteriia bacterium]|nr:nucleotidyltransferase family protein [Terriglobia bacterium]